MFSAMFYRTLVRPWLFRADPEAVHNRALSVAARLGGHRLARETLETLFLVDDRRLRQTVFGLQFPNPVGLGAGYDKNAVGIELWPSLGFGFVEIGTVTARPQPGNESPRLFRQTKQRALINRMGFNNEGAVAISARIPRRPHRIPLGVNVGKDRAVDLGDAARSYLASIDEFHDRADFFVLNVSSPNTPGLRQLQEKEALDELLAVVVAPVRGRKSSISAAGTAATTPAGRSVAGTASTLPVLLKIAPDLKFEQIDDILELAHKYSIAGIVATNTTLDHPTPAQGGLSGVPLRVRATQCVRHIWRHTGGQLPIIGVGGIFTAKDAYEKIRAGASLVEVWTGMIYEGPGIVHNINCGLLRLVARDGFHNIAEAVGTG
ncbi:MAG TPA: quinone-dependent dihydroorotate dehydrogenase [Verrucomicrobiae bacterium]|nr:quinone-dependent dihydroorotate dehydrogenase [Verrucomicrobiae bacterium]